MSLTPEDEQIVHKIAEIGSLRAPIEAVGLIINDSVLELPNRSLRGQDSFQVNIDDIGVMLTNSNISPSIWQDPSMITLWHTHPAGGVGPSRQDMRQRISEIKHLVVALTQSGPVPTWY